MRRFLVNRKGFTLLELLIVVVVLAVLAGLALPQYLKTIGRSKEAEGWQSLATLRSAIMRYYGEAEVVPAAANWGADLDIENPNVATPRYFTYSININTSAFTLTATPTAAVGRTTANVRTLSLDRSGIKTP